MTTPQQFEALRNKVKDTLINFNAYMHEDTHGKTIMVDYDRFTDEIMQVFHRQSLPRFTRKVIEEAMPRERIYKEDFKCGGCGKCEACLLIKRRYVWRFMCRVLQRLPHPTQRECGEDITR